MNVTDQAAIEYPCRHCGTQIHSDGIGWLDARGHYQCVEGLDHEPMPPVRRGVADALTESELRLLDGNR